MYCVLLQYRLHSTTPLRSNTLHSTQLFIPYPFKVRYLIVRNHDAIYAKTNVIQSSLEHHQCLSFAQTWFPFTKKCFVPSSTEIYRVVLEKTNFKILSMYFRNFLRFEKGMAFHLNKLESPSPKDTLCHVWLKLAQWFWRRWKCQKFTDRRTDGRTKNYLYRRSEL